MSFANSCTILHLVIVMVGYKLTLLDLPSHRVGTSVNCYVNMISLFWSMNVISALEGSRSDKVPYGGPVGENMWGFRDDPVGLSENGWRRKFWPWDGECTHVPVYRC